MIDKTSRRVSYYRTDERTETGELVFEFRFYGANGRWQETKSVPANGLDATLEDLRKQGIVAKRISI
jgi:hypothetical protein